MSLQRVWVAAVIVAGALPAPALATGDLVFRNGFERGFTIMFRRRHRPDVRGA